MMLIDGGAPKTLFKRAFGFQQKAYVTRAISVVEDERKEDESKGIESSGKNQGRQ
jgi:hypothetical protein